MRGPASFGLPVILGICVFACGVSRAQHREVPVEDRPLLQHEGSSPFAEEIRQLETATDQAGRRAAFAAILTRAAALERDPDPLNSILINKRPEAVFRDLLEFIRDDARGRHASLVQPLVLAANDSGENAKIAAAAVVAYAGIHEAVPVLIRMLKSDVAGERVAAAAMAGRRVAGTRGAAKLIPHLVLALDRGDADLSAVAMRSLSKQTWIEFATAEEWKEWVRGKTDLDMVIAIADNETAARIKAEQDRRRMEERYQAGILEVMERNESSDMVALTARLRDEYDVIRLRAIALLKPLLKPNVPDDQARPVIDALGELLNRHDERDEVRRGAAGLLADCGKPALAFPHIDRCFNGNGLSPDLRLELARGLNSPLAAKRLAEQLKAEVSQAETRSGALLELLIQQARWVLEPDDQGVHGVAIIGELERLLQLAVRKLGGELDSPARRRFVDVAIRTCEALVQVVLHRGIDISVCVPPLVQLACGETAAANASLTAVRESLKVERARPRIHEILAAPPASTGLAALYTRLIAGTDDVMVVSLLSLYEEIGASPEPLDQLRERMFALARTSEAVLPERPGTRRSMRDALRALLARLTEGNQQHIALVNDLMLCEYGTRDVIGYFMVLKAPRSELIQAALKPHVSERLTRVALVLAAVTPVLTDAERGNNGYSGFRAEVRTLMRARISTDLDGVLKNGADPDAQQAMRDIAESQLRDLWVPVAVEKLRDAAAPGDARDVVAGVLLSTLKKWHRGNYDAVVLAGLSRDEFLRALDNMTNQLKLDGYSLP